MPYNTISNKTRTVKTPGGSLRAIHVKKRGTAPKCTEALAYSEDEERIDGTDILSSQAVTAA